jgi:hypothetical protein
MPATRRALPSASHCLALGIPPRHTRCPPKVRRSTDILSTRYRLRRPPPAQLLQFTAEVTCLPRTCTGVPDDTLRVAGVMPRRPASPALVSICSLGHVGSPGSWNLWNAVVSSLLQRLTSQALGASEACHGAVRPLARQTAAPSRRNSCIIHSSRRVYPGPVPKSSPVASELQELCRGRWRHRPCMSTCGSVHV